MFSCTVFVSKNVFQCLPFPPGLVASANLTRGHILLSRLLVKTLNGTGSRSMQTHLVMASKVECDPLNVTL